MAIILKILAVIGVILLVLLCLLLAVLLAVLFVPVRYRTDISAEGMSVDVSGTVSWLLSLIRIPVVFRFRKTADIPAAAPDPAAEGIPLAAKSAGGAGSGKKTEKEFSWDIRICGLSLKKIRDRKKRKTGTDDWSETPDSSEEDSGKKDPQEEPREGPKEEPEVKPGEKPKSEPKEETKKEPGKEPEEKENLEKTSENKAASSGEGQKNKGQPYTAQEAARRRREGAKKKPSAEPGRQKSGQEKPEIEVEVVKANRPNRLEMLLARYGALIGKLKEAVKKGCSVAEVIQQWLDYTDSDSFEHAVSVINREVRAILRHIVPRKIRGTVEYGMEDPALTGEILAGVAAVYPVIPAGLSILPDFQEKRLEADIQTKGHITVAVLLYRAARMLLTRDVRHLISRIRAKSPEDPVIRKAREKKKRKMRKQRQKLRKLNRQNKK